MKTTLGNTKNNLLDNKFSSVHFNVLSLLTIPLLLIAILSAFHSNAYSTSTTETLATTLDAITIKQNVTLSTIEYKKEINVYQIIEDTITQDELDILARLVYLEARGESDKGEQAVAEVVFNRVISNNFPNTIKEVIYQRGQFSPAKLIKNTKATQREYDNIKIALSGKCRITEDDVLYFSKKPYNNKIYLRIGGHVFCRK